MKLRSDLELGQIRVKKYSQGQILENHVYILEGTVLIQCS